MPRPGGEADKLGNQYEAIWTVDAVLDVFLGKAMSITVEAFGEESEGVEFHLETLDKKIQFHSVKRQNTGRRLVGGRPVQSKCKYRKKHSRRSVQQTSDIQQRAIAIRVSDWRKPTSRIDRASRDTDHSGRVSRGD